MTILPSIMASKILLARNVLCGFGIIAVILKLHNIKISIEINLLVRVWNRKVLNNSCASTLSVAKNVLCKNKLKSEGALRSSYLILLQVVREKI